MKPRPVRRYRLAAGSGKMRLSVIGEAKGFANARGEEIEELLLEMRLAFIRQERMEM